jgi:hypothetical protein
MKQCILLVCLTLVPGSLWAQGTLHDWNALHLSDGMTVYVLDETGQETIGTLLRLDADSLVLLVEGIERRVESAQVKRVARRGDPLRNGFYVGAAIGAALGLIADCHYRHQLCGTGRKVAFVAGAAGLYAGIGVGIDALKQGRTTLYQAPEAGSRSPVQQPSARRRYSEELTVSLTFRW